MKITICGSVAFYEHMVAVQKQLWAMGHEVTIPDAEFTNGAGEAITIPAAYSVRKTATAYDTWVWRQKGEAIREHFKKIDWADCIFVLNYEKNGIPGYIGANTLMEMGLAFYRQKPIYLLNPIPTMAYTEEIRGTCPVVIDGVLEALVV